MAAVGKRYGRTVSAEQIGEGGSKGFQRLADVLRARIADGTYPVTSFLPPQRALAEEFDVSRDMVQRALRELSDEGWIESRQGSGVRVVRAPEGGNVTARHGVTLGLPIAKAFERPEVSLDVYTLTSESLDLHMRLQVERIRQKEITPQRIGLRVLLPHESMQLPYPRSKGDPADARPQERLREITRRHVASLRGPLRDLLNEKLVSSIDVEVRHVPLAPAFKLYLLNGVEALHGVYEVVERPIELDGGEVIEALDVMGLGATLTRHVKDDDPNSPGTVFVDSMQKWFDSVWEFLSE